MASLSFPSKSARSTKSDGMMAPPALERHARASNHSIEWTHDEECEITDEPFATRSLYFENTRSSPTHQDVTMTDDILYSLGTLQVASPGGECHQLNGANSTNTQPKSVATDLYVCHEPCCRRFGTDYKCKSEYDRHSEAPFHLSAVDINITLLAKMQPSPALIAEQESIRNLRCSATRCPMYGRIFSTAKGFFGHLSKDEHRKNWAVTLAHAVSEDRQTTPEMDDVEYDENKQEWTCLKWGCPRFGYVFTHASNITRHVRGMKHVLAGQDRGTHIAKKTPSFTTPKSATQDPFITPIDMSTVIVNATPLSPSAGRGLSVNRCSTATPRKSLPTSAKRTTPRKTPKAPTASMAVQKRQDDLERRNAELEQRVKILEEKLEKVIGTNNPPETDTQPVGALYQFIKSSFRPKIDGEGGP
ncbi:hypothetical protein FZEAL_1159 [Fusarium zealandicum]|uniref:Uncharacterized protein n=1 Tax=Fusarium zealandicum TaxID=1053134 RepID=A0A8H4UTZ9_9HYPO|nr:hypothetical protein FZEAL_1159 [Fusarium zealandicum]